MVRETYSKADVAKYLHEKFIPMHINAEKGEGPKVAGRFGIISYPTIVLVSPEGEEIDRLLGYHPPARFLEALKPFLEGKSFRDFKQRHAKNPKDYDAALLLGKKYEERDAADRARSLYQSVLKAEDASKELKIRARGRVQLLDLMESEEPEKAFLELAKFFAENSDKVALTDQAMFLFNHYAREGKSEELVGIGDYLLKHGEAENPAFLNAFAWYLAQSDQRLDQALEMAKKAVKLEAKDANILDTLAEAYYRKKLYKEAVETQKKAVELASARERPGFEARLKNFEKALEETK